MLTELDGAPLVNSSTLSTIMTHLFPITPIELGPGFVIGTDRLITKVSGVFHAPNSSQTAAVYVYKDCLQVADASSGGRVPSWCPGPTAGGCGPTALPR